MFNPGPEQIRDAAIYVIALIASIAVHEFGHAFVADRLGDPTPRSQGRVTLNPIAHIDPIGTIIVPLIVFFTGAPIIGWGKPVQVSPLAYVRRTSKGRRISMSTGDILVTAAGPAMNVILALIVTIIFAILLATRVISVNSSKTIYDITEGIIKVIMLNWSLVFFNLIPCPPLDGSWILFHLLPRKYEHITDFMGRYGFLILWGLVLTGVVNYFLIPARYLTMLCSQAALAFIR